MTKVKTKLEIESMRKAGKVVGDTHLYLKEHIKVGITTKELNELAHKYIISRGAKPSFKDLYDFPASVCISLNEEVVHGIPSDYALQEGDIISIDIGAEVEGHHGDSAWTYSVGKISTEKEYLMRHTEEALFEGLNKIKDGVRVGDISNAIEKYAKKYNLGVVKELTGHGIGTSVHEDPYIPNYGKANTGPILKAGMTICVEPMLTYGSNKILQLDDDWTIVTADGKPSAHYEHTILILEDGYEILTKR